MTEQTKVQWQPIFDELFAGYCRDGMGENAAHRAAQDAVDMRRARAGGSITYTRAGAIRVDDDGLLGAMPNRTETFHFDETGLPIGQWVQRMNDDDYDDRASGDMPNDQ